MALPPIPFPPSMWSNQDIVLYHGTVDAYASAIETKIRVKMGKPGTDFGPGFYLTTFRYQAQQWAAKKAAELGLDRNQQGLIEITVSRAKLAVLETLAFVRGERDAVDYWSFVHHCRKGGDHRRTGAQKFYDAVYGPVAKYSPPHMTYAGFDQVSFHTPAAEKLLNASTIKRIK